MSEKGLHKYEAYIKHLPNDWEIDSVSKLGKVVGGGTPSRDVVSFWNGTLPWATPGEVSKEKDKVLHDTQEHVTPSGLAASGAHLLPKNSLMVTTRATIGARAINAVPMATNQGFKSIIFKETADASFYYYQFEMVKPELIRRASGTTFLEISATEFALISLPSPSPEEKRLITQTLDTFDIAIRQTEAIIAKLQQMKQGLLHDLLTRGINAKGELRPSVEEAPQLYKESPLGWVPKEWEIKPLQSVSDVIDPQPDHRTPREISDGVPYIGIGDFDEDGEVNTNTCRKVIWSALIKQLQRFEVASGDIIFGKIGTIGQPKKLFHGRYALSANVLLIKPAVNASFLYHALASAPFVKQIQDITNTTSQPALGIQTVRELFVQSPELDEQQMMASKLDALDQNLKSESFSLMKLQKQKSGLMDDLLTGRVRVTPLLNH